MKLEQYALNGSLDPEESSSDAESIADAADLIIHQAMEDPVGVLGGNGPPILGPGGIDYTGQTLILVPKPGTNEICMFVQGDPALEEFLSPPPESQENDSINGVEDVVCDISLSEEDSKQEDNVSHDENDSKKD